EAGPAQARHGGDDRGAAALGGVHARRRQRRRDPLRTRRADVRQPHAQHARPLGDPVRAANLAPSDPRRPLARDGKASEGPAAGAGGRGGGRRRFADRGTQPSRGGALRRTAGPAAGDVHGSDGTGAAPRAGARTYGVKGLLVLEDGTAFRGEAIGRPGTSFGEIVFNTAMSGYQEVLTDPSYAGQIVVMTAAHIGNYGIRGDEARTGRGTVAGILGGA